ncbi:MAG: alpha-hydroxy acid oxidase [Beijerinckiaceae bacterium]
MRVLPRPIFDYIDGGSDDEIALRRSTTAFDDIEFLPRSLVDISSPQHSIEIFGKRIPFPLLLSPTGLTALFHRDAESAVARAAGEAGLPYCLSTLGNTTVEDFAAACTGPKLFQIYIFKDRGLTEEFVQRAKASAYAGLILTVDTLIPGKRERDIASGLKLPPQLTPRAFLEFARRPKWSLPALFGNKFEFVNVSHRAAGLSGQQMSLVDYIGEQFDRSVSWKDVEWLAEKWGGPLAVKGLVTGNDARTAVNSGADTIYVSNHGGRQLETCVPPIRQIADVADAVSGQAKIVCDGGIRRGTHIVKALAMGADACSVGRAYLYGLAAGGQSGVARAIAILREEYERTMTLLGAASPQELNRTVLTAPNAEIPMTSGSPRES